MRLRESWGLGNHLFQIAGSFAIATSRGVDLMIPAEWRYREFFSIPNTWFAGSLRTWRCAEAWEFATNLEPAWARPHLQDVGLWKGLERDIHALLQPSERALDASTITLGDQANETDKTAIHVRRGDYLSPTTRLRPCPLSYYAAAIELVAAETPNTQFLIFSDDIDWCRRELHIDGAIFVSGNPDWLDLALMSRCDRHICANSTFSWWGAFLSRDPAPIAPWLPGVLPDNFRRIFPSHWRVLEVHDD